MNFKIRSFLHEQYMYCTTDIALVIEERAIIANMSAFYQNLKRI